MKTMKKIVAILAVALMLCSILPLSVFAAESTVSYDFSTFSGSSTQYAQQSHDLGNGLNVSMVGCHINTQLRFYNSQSSVEAIFNVTDKEITSMTLNAGYKAGNMTVSTSADGATWSDAGSITTTTSYTNYTVNFDSSAKYVKLGKGTGTAQIRIKTVSFTVVDAAGGEEPPVTCEHVWVDADCTNAKTCSLCGETEGEALGHSYGEGEQTAAPDCTNAGEMKYTCSVCGDVKTETVKALGHTYVDGVCSVCGEAQPLEVTIETFANTGVLDGTDSISWTNSGFQFTSYKASSTSAIRTSDADHFRIYAHNKVVVSGLNGELLTKVQFNATSDSYATVLGGCAAEGWVASVDGTVVTFTATAANGAENLTIEDVSAQTRVSSVIITPYVASESDCEHDYVGVETQAPSCTVEGVTTYTCSKCGESYTEAIATIPHNYVADIIDSTCTTTGTATYECSVCFDSYDEVIPVKPHNYVDDVCDVCGAVKAYKGTLVFDADKENRTEFSTQIQVWESNGLTFTNNKLSGNNIADYGAPVRIYKNSGIVIEFPEMSTLIIDASGVGNDYLWDATLEAAGLSFTVENKIYTITFAEAVNSLELTCANQVRANSITAIVAHEHVYDNDFDTDCNKCGEVRAVVGPVTFGGCSRSEDVSGLAFKFDVAVDGMTVNGTKAIYDDATINGYKLVKMGAIVSNAKSELDIEAKYLCDLEADSASFAVRVINIPEANYGDAITAVPYFVVEIDGVATTIYGEAQVASYNG